MKSVKRIVVSRDQQGGRDESAKHTSLPAVKEFCTTLQWWMHVTRHLSKLRLTLVTLLSKLHALFRSHLFSHSSPFSVPRSSLGYRSAFGHMIFRWWISRISEKINFSFSHLYFLLFVFTPYLTFSRSFFLWQQIKGPFWVR